MQEEETEETVSTRQRLKHSPLGRAVQHRSQNFTIQTGIHPSRWLCMNSKHTGGTLEFEHLSPLVPPLTKTLIQLDQGFTLMTVFNFKDLHTVDVNIPFYIHA